MRPPWLLALLPALAAPAAAQAALFDRVAAVLAERYFDRGFCRERLPSLVASHRPAALAAGTRDEERAVVHALLAAVPSSHLALWSTGTRERLEAEVAGRRTPTLGCTLSRHAGRFFVDSLYEGGPAAGAGLRRGDEVVALDGDAPGRSELLDWRSDDAALPDPPTHELRVAEGQQVVFGIADAGGPRAVPVVAAPWSGLAASIASVRAVPLAGGRALYLHLWFVFHGRSARLIEAAMHDHPGAAGLVLDLRGRGGSALECGPVIEVLERAHRQGLPIVALVDDRTRSAKEVIAWDLQQRELALLVGEPTAGAVLPASFARVAHDAVLMLPERRLGAYTRRLEGRGVAPDVPVADPFPPEPGTDPVLWAGLEAMERLLESSSARRPR